MISITMQYDSVNNINPITWRSLLFVSKFIHCHLSENAQIQAVTISNPAYISIDTDIFYYKNSYYQNLLFETTLYEPYHMSYRL